MECLWRHKNELTIDIYHYLPNIISNSNVVLAKLSLSQLLPLLFAFGWYLTIYFCTASQEPSSTFTSFGCDDKSRALNCLKQKASPLQLSNVQSFRCICYLCWVLLHSAFPEIQWNPILVPNNWLNPRK